MNISSVIVDSEGLTVKEYLRDALVAVCTGTFFEEDFKTPELGFALSKAGVISVVNDDPENYEFDWAELETALVDYVWDIFDGA